MKNIDCNKLLLCFLVLFSSASIWSNKQIGKIEITGLKRTKERVVTDLLDVNEGDSIEKFNEDEFKQRVLKTGIFSAPEITYIEEEDSVDLSINLKEKWTLIPMPMISVAPEESNFGITVFDSNFLGLKKIAMAGFDYSTKNKFLLTLIYIDDNLISKNTGVFFSANTSNKESDSPDFKSAIGITNRSFKDISLGTTLVYSHLIQDLTYDYLIPGVSVTINKQKYSDTIQTGWSSSLKYAVNFDLNRAEISSNLLASAKVNFNPAGRLYVGANISGSALNKPDPLEFKLGGSVGSRVLQSAENVDEYISGDINTEFILLDLSWGAVSINGFFEAGIYDGNRIKSKLYYGPGAGAAVYLKGVAIPALGFNFGYNIEAEEPNFSLNFGLSM